MRQALNSLIVYSIACSSAAAPIPLAAQAATAAVVGAVIAPSGSTLGGAQIDLRNRETGETRHATAGAAGRFRIVGVAPGLYDITARAIGYRAERRALVELVLGETSRIDFTLVNSDSSVTLEPTVVTAGAASGVERLDVSTAIHEREIERLPLNTRDALALAAIAPGIRSFAPEAGRAVPGAGAVGGGARFVNLYVDGAEWKGAGTGQLVGQPAAGSLIPQDAIREFRVALNPYDAQYTHGASWVMSAVTHQGSNGLHGSLFGFGQDRDLIARGAHQTVKPAYQRSQIGGNVRGPIVRDRFFYSASYEGQITDNYIDVLPGRPSYKPGIWDQYAGTFRAPFRNHLGMVRLTAVHASHTVDATWLARSLTAESNFGIQVSGVMLSHEAAVVSRYRVGSLQLRDRFTSGAFVNELSLHWLDDYESDAPLVTGVARQYPSIQTGRTSYPIVVREHHASLADHVSYSRRGLGGEHVVKAGLELTRLHGYGFQPTGNDGILFFSTDTSTLPRLATIGLGFVDPRSTNDAIGYQKGSSVGAYLQDQWRPMPSFAVTVGLRYDAELNTLNQNLEPLWARDTTLQRLVGTRYLDTRHRKDDLDDVAPRLALAWDVAGRGHSVLRAGYGVMYDRLPRYSAVYEAIGATWRIYQFTNPGTTDIDELRRRVLAGATAVPPNVVLLPDRMQTPATRQWSVGLGQRLHDGLTLQLDYLDQRMTHLPVTVRANALVAGRRPLTSRFGDITLWGDFGDATYRGLLSSLTFERQSSRWTLAYTLGWSRAEFPGISTSDYPDSTSYTMQWSGADERHRVVLAGMTDGPFGLQLSTIATVASPHPFGVIVGTDVNRNGSISDDWPSGIRTSRWTGWPYWYRTVDLRLGKAIGAGRGRLVATVDVFNVFNWASHSEYRGTASLPDYRQPIGDYARRQVQIGTRYVF